MSRARPYTKARGLGVAALLVALATSCGTSRPSTTSSVSPSPETGGVTQQGLASYYAQSLAGRRTASGEPYNPGELTAAHRTLRFGTVVRVTRLETGQSVVVRINDRGPYKSGRVIDLSMAAARRLDMVRAGVVRVRLQILSSGR
jgi:rare lipoprotein A